MLLEDHNLSSPDKKASPPPPEGAAPIFATHRGAKMGAAPLYSVGCKNGGRTFIVGYVFIWAFRSYKSRSIRGFAG